MQHLSILAASVLVAWDYSPEVATAQQVKSFTLYVGIQSVVAGNPPIMVWEVQYPTLQQAVDGLEYGTTYYFTTKAWNAVGSSEYSGELMYTPIPDPTPTPEPTPIPTPVDDGQGQHKGWYK